jgi:hypothetical protein
MISALISGGNITRIASEPEANCGSAGATLEGAELGCLGRLFSYRVIDNDIPLFYAVTTRN